MTKFLPGILFFTLALCFKNYEISILFISITVCLYIYICISIYISTSISTSISTTVSLCIYLNLRPIRTYANALVQDPRSRSPSQDNKQKTGRDQSPNVTSTNTSTSDLSNEEPAPVEKKPNF